MIKKHKIAFISFILLLVIAYPTWYGVNYYAAGTVDQISLIEFGMQEDFKYCKKWRPEELDINLGE